MDKIQVYTPNNISELIIALSKATPSSKLIAGGTDYFIDLHKIHNSNRSYDMLIDLSGVMEIKGIGRENDWLVVGAGATFTEIQNNIEVKKYFPCLAEAASMVGSTQIRNRATIGGNIANASPAADSIPPLLALDAQIMLLNSKGEFYDKPLYLLLQDICNAALEKDAAIVSIKIPIPEKAARSTFVKLGSRSTVTISKISMAVVLTCSEDDEIIDASIALGAVSRTAYRPIRIEQRLMGSKLTPDLGDLLGEWLTEEMELVLKGRSSVSYKKEAIKGLAHDALLKLF